MNIKFLNHSSLLVSSREVSVLCDPWFTGTAFNGWRLLKEDSHNINLIEFDYIWISHEHPDHFSIPTLNQLKSRKTFLYQETKDKKVSHWIRGKGHDCIEIKPYKRYKFKDLEFITYPCKGYDTAIAFENNEGECFLNANDCKLDECENIKLIKKNHKNIIFFAAQYSYANWAGNDNDFQTPILQQELINKRIYTLSKEFDCNRVFLFASFIYFSHYENFFLNKNKPLLQTIYNDLVSLGLKPSILRPNQYLDKKSFDNNSLNKDSAFFWDEINQRKEPIDKPADINFKEDDLKKTYKTFFKKLWENNSLEINKSDLNKDFSIIIKISVINIYVKIWLFDLKIKFIEKLTVNTELVCELSYEMLIFLLSFNYGRGTLTINGRIKFNYKNMHKFFIFFYIPYANNIGENWNRDKLTRNQLLTIKDSSIMSSIFSSNKDLLRNFEKDIDLFL